MKKIILFAIVFLTGFVKSEGQLVSDSKTDFTITDATILVDENDFPLVKKAAALLQQDIKLVTGKEIPIIHQASQSAKNLIAIGSTGNSAFIKELIKNKIISTTNLANKWEAYSIQSINNSTNNQTPKSPLRGVGGLSLRGRGGLLVITGSDRRGVVYGVFELSRQIGVSPWYWWADVPVVKKENIYIRQNVTLSDSPKVKYRGIFINDEAPALSSWSKEKFGGFNHQFYEKVFELMLRLKANYLWPAMWGNAFYDDDSLNIKSADAFGIVMGTSHHEPLMRAHDEWRRYGKGKWNYDSNEVRLKEFWKAGMRRATNEKIVSVGMRGDGDEPMSRETATSLLERIVKDQREIIADVTGKPAAATPQLWALYKEVQDYYDKGMRVPDDVTLLLCDDNWGNLRKLPKITDAPRKGGYGIYYHFDYVGGPRNYKWLNTNPIARVWEQMHLAYEYNAKQIWIVNVGDIKPMEFPISFFLDYAWNPEKIGADDLQKYTEQWALAQFGEKYAKDIADIISKYTKYNSRRKPELLNQNTYSLNNYNEFETIVKDYNALLAKTETINSGLAPEYKDAFFQLVLYPVKACANLNELYFYTALNNRQYNRFRNYNVNMFAERAMQLYRNDSMLTLQYHHLNAGKWNHMMSQTHIGYTYWQQPEKQTMPEIHWLPKDSVITLEEDYVNPVLKNSEALVPKNSTENLFYEKQFSGVSINASHFTKAFNSNHIIWTILPDHGRTVDAVTTFPVTAGEQNPTANSPHLEYEFYTYSRGDFKINAYFSPTLNFNNTAAGLQYAISVDDEMPELISINKEDKNIKLWEKWVADNIIIKTSRHFILNKGKHTLKYWMVNSGIVLQKFVLDFGDVEESYLGPPETIGNKISN